MDMQLSAQIILFAPLVGAILCGFGWRLIGEKAATWLTTLLLFVGAILSWYIFLTFQGDTQHITVLRFIESGTLSTEWGIRLDRMSAIMLVVVNSVSALVHLYSQGYMAHDENWAPGESYRPRFFAYLSFFTFSMLALITSDNLVQMFFGWEGVGVASYLLIGFYYRKPSANAAAIKAFVVNRVGDFGFALGIFALYYLTDSIKFDEIFAAAPQLAQTQLHFLWTDWNAANLIGVLLFIGACGKSAQLFLHTWLPDAMEGPTPVSALIHAATMVTAGVFLVCRMSPLYEYAPDAKTMIVVIGATTAFFAATVGLVQNDIKRVIAYSTCSQLGYMFVAAGVGMYPVAMFHLFTHAFFKAMLFLGAGSVITAMHHEQDMRNYGGLRKKIPLTFWAMMIGTLAITGVGIPLTHYGFAGFLSKDAVIESAWVGSNYAFTLLVIAAFMTSFYSWRLMFMTFYGKPKGDTHAHDHAHESPATMLIPLGLLALGAVFAGMVWYNSFFGDEAKMRAWFNMEPAHEEMAEAAEAPAAVADATATAEVASTTEPAASVSLEPGIAPKGAIYLGADNHVLHHAHEAPNWVKVSPFIAMVLGFLLAWKFYIRSPELPGKLAAQQRPLYLFLLNKWYFDELYNVIFVKPAFWLGNFLWKKGDGVVIDGALNGVAMGIIPFFTKLAGRWQSGYVFTYAFAMVLGIAALLTWMTLTVGH
ncbi:NADH-quinone oxidoreductase subunit L [Cypionkella psychrotolerans]|uniref:NADH-quinone oxidoreductase subunit L n=1 Tax=Cypionkella psychrotolerans TaxID=1678131 RepID=UPI000A6520E1|nr:NADH-quinone oxidoreductase subunit L [Cypionkella psychrotolerans]